MAKMGYNGTKVSKPSVFQRNEETFGRGATEYSLKSSVADEAEDARVGARAQASGTRTAHLSAKLGSKFGTYLRKVVPKMGYRCLHRTAGPSGHHSSRRESASRSESGVRRPLTPTIPSSLNHAACYRTCTKTWVSFINTLSISQNHALCDQTSSKPWFPFIKHMGTSGSHHNMPEKP